MQSHWHGFFGITKSLEVHKRVGPKAFHRNEIEIATEITTVASRNRQPVTQSSQRGFFTVIQVVGRFDADKTILNLWICSCKEVAPDLVDLTPRNATAFVRNLDDHVLVLGAIGNDNFDRGQCSTAVHVLFHGGAQRVLEQLQQNVVQVGGNVGKGEIKAARHFDARTPSVGSPAHHRSVGRRLPHALRRTRFLANHADKVLLCHELLWIVDAAAGIGVS